MSKKVVKIKAGVIIKNYRDEYSKIIAVRNGSAYLSPWTRKESVAKKAERGDIRFNSIGVSRAIKQEVELVNDGIKKAKDDTKTDDTETKVLSVKELKAILKKAGLKVSGTQSELLARVGEIKADDDADANSDDENSDEDADADKDADKDDE